MHYLVIDLEATCSDDGSIPRGESEIIEIGSVMVEAAGLKPVAEWQRFVRPVQHPALSPFCVGLTSIEQEDVDSAARFSEVLAELVEWMGAYDELVWCSWGAYDRNQFRQDCQFHKIAYPMPEHLNLKIMFTEQMGFKRAKGVRKALRIVKLEFEGTHHRGIDDARNIARLLPWAMGRAN